MLYIYSHLVLLQEVVFTRLCLRWLGTSLCVLDFLVPMTSSRKVYPGSNPSLFLPRLSHVAIIGCPADTNALIYLCNILTWRSPICIISPEPRSTSKMISPPTTKPNFICMLSIIGNTIWISNHRLFTLLQVLADAHHYVYTWLQRLSAARRPIMPSFTWVISPVYKI